MAGSLIEPLRWLGIEPHRRPGVEPHRRLGNEPHGSGNEPHGSGNEPHRPGTRKGAEPGAPGDPLVAAAVTSSSLALLDEFDPDQMPLLAQAPDAAARFWIREPWVRGVLAVQAMQALLVVDRGVLLVRTDPRTRAQDLLTLLVPGADLLGAATEAVVRRRDERPERMAEILSQVDGFWPFWASVTGIDPAQSPRTVELLAAASALSPLIGLPLKQNLDVRRPYQSSSRVQPAIPTPGHGSYPSGHSTAAHLEAALLCALLDLDPKKHLMHRQLRATARRIADNREVAGVHYRCDSDAGAALGAVLAEFVVACCVPGKRLHVGRSFDPADPNTVSEGKLSKSKSLLPLEEMWKAARRELGVA
jgi:PAP2 superfamily